METKSDEIKKAIEENNERIKNTENQMSSISKAKHEATKKLAEELDAIQKPFDKQYHEADKFKSTLYDRGTKLQLELCDAINEEAVAKAKKTGEHTVESADAYLELNGVKIGGGYSSDARLSEKKVLPNGIKVFRSNSDCGGMKKYFAFIGMRLVGYWEKRNSEHAGDDQYSKAWIGVGVCKSDNELENLENVRLTKKYGNDKWKSTYDGHRDEHKYYRTKEGMRWGRMDVTYNQFVKELEAIPEPGELGSINVKKTISEGNTEMKY